MKKLLTSIFAAVCFLFLLTGCASNPETGVPAAKDVQSGKINIVATLFPQYDFARQIAGDRAEVTLLLPPGVESHSYEPTPSDIIRINQSDLFLYTGAYMEAWSQKIIDGMQDSGSGSLVVDLSKGIRLASAEEIEGSQGHDAAVEPSHEEEPYDPHIWTDPLNAKVMVSNILDALCRIDPANAEYYRKNAANYNKELDVLDAEFRAVVSGGKRNKILFGSRFALYYFVKEYGLQYDAAFDSCSAETEPSAKTVAGLIEKIRKEKIPVIYYAEIEDPKVAKSISAETGVKMLLFHSVHNLTKAELKNGATYLSLMKQNAENLKEGLE